MTIFYMVASTSGPGWYGEVTIWPDFATNSSNPAGSMVFSFDGGYHDNTRILWIITSISGVSVALLGNTAKLSQEFQVAIDSTSPYTTSTTDDHPQTWMQWYQSPVLKAGHHTLNVSSMRGTALDLILITPGPETSLDGQTLLVDDTYPGVKYIGDGWKEVADQQFNQVDNVLARPVQNGTHQTSHVGDSMSFSFSGMHLPRMHLSP